MPVRTALSPVRHQPARRQPVVRVGPSAPQPPPRRTKLSGIRVAPVPYRSRCDPARKAVRRSRGTVESRYRTPANPSGRWLLPQKVTYKEFP